MGNLNANTGSMEQYHHQEGARSRTSGFQGYLIFGMVIGMFVVALVSLAERL
jgi:tetrahydromethanopterin S-methyltransferase subunit B